jgi:thiopeptide-type bacteriocin biosynthesis protein
VRPGDEHGDWYSIHIYDHGDRDALITEAVVPALSTLGFGPGDYFFIRYWSCGPHLRLRVRMEDGSRIAFLERFRKLLGCYFGRRPPAPEIRLDEYRETQRILGALEGQVAGAELVPDGTVRPEPYHPERHKYGGRAGVEIAERLFCAGSALTSAVLRAVRDDPENRLFTALCMMVDALSAARLSTEQAVPFLDAYTKYWSGYVSREESAQWPARLAAHRAELGTSIPADLGHTALSRSRTRWREAVGEAFGRLTDLPPACLTEVADRGAATWPLGRKGYILCHYLHTQNNRLGILASTEVYLALLAKGILRSRPG